MVARKVKAGRIQTSSDDTGVSIEKKKYTLSELSGLKGKFKKIDTDLGIDGEKSQGKSIMVNMRTSVFEVLKSHLLKLLLKNPLVKTAKQIRIAKAETDIGTEAEIEYHVDVEFSVDDKEHCLKLKIFNTNCRIQIQHAGKASHAPQHYLSNRCPPKFFAEEVILPFCKSIEASIPEAKEKEFVVHLRKEIQRLKKSFKDESKQKKDTCVNS